MCACMKEFEMIVASAVLTSPIAIGALKQMFTPRSKTSTHDTLALVFFFYIFFKNVLEDYGEELLNHLLCRT